MKKYKGLASGIITIVLAIGIYFSSDTISKSVKTTIGPDFMPKLVAAIMGVLGLLLMVRELKLLNNKGLQEDEKADPEKQTEPKSWKRVAKNNIDIIALIVLLLYPVLVSILGFLPASIIYMVGHTLLLLLKQKRNYLLIVLYSVVFSTAAYFFFVKVLHVMLPSGILG